SQVMKSYRPDPQTLTPDQRTIRFGWDYNWGDGNQNRNRAISDIVLTEIPTYIEPGDDVSFKATMRGDWLQSGYGNDRDHTIRLNGALGTGQFQVGGNPSGSYNGGFDSRNLTVAPQPQNGAVVFTSTANLRFGDDHA